jgi:hypothetical protein
MNTVIGWVDSYNRSYRIAPFNNDRKKALVERIRKLGYNFTHFDHELMPYGAPFYDDERFCVLTKAQLDDVMNEAYRDLPRGQRLMPRDAIVAQPINGVLYEKQKFAPKDGEDHV